MYDAPCSELITQASFSLLELDDLGGSCLMLQHIWACQQRRFLLLYGTDLHIKVFFCPKRNFRTLGFSSSVLFY